MCIILDVNRIGKFKNPADEDMGPVRYWLKSKNGKIVCSDTEQFRREWDAGGGHLLRRNLQRRGKLNLISPQQVLEKENELKGQIKSNDSHIIALAMVADVKVLVSEDKTLHKDFKNPRLVGGRVYQTKSHSRLLRKDTCP